MVELAMRQANGNQTHAARLLDISRDALRYKLQKFELVGAGEGDSADSLTSETLPANNRFDSVQHRPTRAKMARVRLLGFQAETVPPPKASSSPVKNFFMGPRSRRRISRRSPLPYCRGQHLDSRASH
jgi:hypothetical protein